MKRVVLVLVAVGLAAGAYAVDGRIFLTYASEGYGLVQPENACTPTFSEVDLDGNNYNAFDYYYGNGPFVVDAFPPADHPGYTADNPLVLPASDPGQFVYLWLQFDMSAPKGTMINGLILEVQDYDTGELIDGVTPVYYLCNDMATSGLKRWNGPATAPDYPEFAGNNPQTLVAVTAWGLRRHTPDVPEQLYTGLSGGLIALLGAICLDDFVEYGQLCQVKITDINYSEGSVSPEDWLADTVFTVIPEPSALFLLALLGAAVRPR
jgi:hypothetical protein